MKDKRLFQWLASACTLSLAVTGLTMPNTVAAAASASPAAAPTGQAGIVGPAEADGCSKWAATNGDDGNPGTEAAPYRSLSKLVSTLGAGQVGCLPAGETYYSIQGNGVVGGGNGTAAEPVTITSGPGGMATVQGQLWLKPESHDIQLSGMTFRGNYGPNGAPLGTKTTHLILHGDRITIADNDIADPRGICIGAGKAHASDPAINDRADDLVITRNRIHDCGMDPSINWSAGDSGAHGVYLENTLGAVVTENLIYRNRYRGLQLWPRNDGANIHHNLFDENATHVNIGSSEACGGDCRVAGAGFISQNTNVHDNIFTNRVTDWAPSQNPSQVYGFFLEGSPTYGNVVHHNCFAPGDAAATGNGFAQYDNQTAQATFVDRGARDYRLLVDSPCQGKGPASIQPDTKPGVTNTSPPTISGTPQVGATLTTSGGSWNPTDVNKAYQWLRDGAPITGASTSSYTLVAADEGAQISVQVTASRTGYNDAVATSSPVGPIQPGNGDPTYRPDAMVRTANGAFKGNDIYNTNGAGQRVKVWVKRGSRTIFYVKLANDANVADDWSIAEARANTRGFSRTWRLGRRTVTAEVATGNLLFYDIEPGMTRLLKLSVRPTRNAKVGQVATWYLHVVHNPLSDQIRDVVKIQVVATR